MRRDNKKFVSIVIIASVAALIALMILLFMVLQSFLGDKQTVTPMPMPEQEEGISSKVELSESLLILVQHITEKSIEGYDIKNNNSVNKYLSDTTRVSDAYGNVIPIKEIKKGDIISLECAYDDSEVFSVSKTSEVQSWKKINGITIDQKNQMISVGGANFKYTNRTMIINEDGQGESINNIGPYDVVSVQVYDSTVWSLIVNDASASISIRDLPISKGTIEIDNSRLINFADITEPIKVIPGKHKLVIRMEGYEVISLDVDVTSGETYDITLADAKKAYTIIKPSISPNIGNYEIKIGDKTYKPGEEIKVEQGKYIVTITAEGYQTQARNILLTVPEYPLSIVLKKIEKEEETPEVSGNIATATEDRTITLSTDPSGAKVYIDSAMKGQTPFTTTLSPGGHVILFEKDGYAVYSTTILIDPTNDQNNYLYVLTKIE